MDEYKDTVQQVQEEQEALKATAWNYPFIVEITAAMLLDSCGLKASKQWTEDPALLNNIHVLIDFVGNMNQKLKAEDPAQAREETPFTMFYTDIPGYRPELDPESKAFDTEQYWAAIMEMGQEAFLDSVSVRFAEMIKEQEKITELLPELEGFGFEMQKALASLYNYLNSDRFLEVIRAAREKAGVPAVKNDPRTIAKQAEKLLYPLDKPNSKIWNMLTKANKNGQMGFNTAPDQNAVVLFSINFDDLPPELKISKTLTPTDKRVYVALHALYVAGNEIVTVTQIHRQMGNKSKPSQEQLEKIWDSVKKMGFAAITIDTEREAEAAEEGSKLKERFKYIGTLLPFEAVPAWINDRFTEAAIHLLREPPLVDFAKQRDQVTTIGRKLLESPISKTDANLRLEDYLLERIGRMKNLKNNAPRKMLFSTIYENCDITSWNQRQRTPEKIARYLTWYKECEWIKDFDMLEDAAEIAITEDEADAMKNRKMNREKKNRKGTSKKK